MVAPHTSHAYTWDVATSANAFGSSALFHFKYISGVYGIKVLNDKAKYILYDADRDKIGEQVIRS